MASSLDLQRGMRRMISGVLRPTAAYPSTVSPLAMIWIPLPLLQDYLRSRCI